VSGVPRWGAGGATGLPTQMPNGEWVRYDDHIAALRRAEARAHAAVLDDGFTEAEIAINALRVALSVLREAQP